MPPELIALIDKPVLLVAILFLGAVIGIHVEKFVRWESRQVAAAEEWRAATGSGEARPVDAEGRSGPCEDSDPLDQFPREKLMN